MTSIEPFSLEKLAGNEKILDLLRHGRLPQSSIFSGPSGVGKRTAALLLAALYNCRQPSIQKDLCGTCSSCIKCAGGNHPDIQLFQTDQSKIKIDLMRQLSKEVQYRPFEGRARFFIIDEAERMTPEAANSILKTLEEPPPSSHLVLVTAYPQRLLETIRSRCQTIHFHPLTRQEIAHYLRERRPELDEPELRAGFAQGSLGRALDLDLETTLERRDQMLKLLTLWVTEQRFQGVYRLCESKQLKSLLRKREEVLAFLELLQHLCYDLYFVQIGTPDRVTSRDQLSKLEALSGHLDLDSLRRLLEEISKAKRDVERYVSPLICFQTLWLGQLDLDAPSIY